MHGGKGDRSVRARALSVSNKNVHMANFHAKECGDFKADLVLYVKRI